MSLQRIDLNLLVALDTLLAERHVTRAARRLGLSQPALSAQLRQLRELLSDPLLLPAGRGMVPTPRALELQQPLRRLLTEMNALIAAHQPFDPLSADDTFRIASTDGIQAALCVPLSQHLFQAAPGVRLALLPPDSGRLEDKMATGEIDLALLNPAILPGSLMSRRIYDETFLSLARPDHPLGDELQTLDGFCAAQHLLVSPAGGGFVGTVDETLAALGRKRRVALSITNFLLAPQFVAQSDLVATLPARLARRFPDRLTLFAPPFPLEGFAVHMAWHPRAQADPAHAWLRQQIVDLRI